MQPNHTIRMHDSSLTIRSRKANAIAAAGIVVLAILFQLIPSFGEVFQWQREGGILTYLTGHLTHWSWNHLIWDLTAFATLSFAAIRLIPERFLLGLLVAGIVVPIEIALNQTQFETYRGLSGIDSALLGLVIVGLWKLRRGARIIAGITLAAFGGKTIYEVVSGDTIFVEQAQQAFTPATSAHVSGFLAGLVAGFIPPFGIRMLEAKRSR